jgi:drug/metabolite transporter (DMT)-like permease
MGLAAALGGLGYLTLPGAAAPDPIGAILMLAAGVSWGVYSIRGRGVTEPVVATAASFVRAVPMVVLVSVVTLAQSRVELAGLVLAIVSGGVTSGLGYVLWYRALRELTRTRAAIVQLSVPPITAFGGVVFLAEDLSTRLLISTLFILGGVAMAVSARRRA